MIHKKHIPTVLIILDGFGFRTNPEGNAVSLADTPNLTKWLKEYPHTLLRASGIAVGLPEGFVGNSEVGHMAIGCGRIIQQPLSTIQNAIANGSFFSNPILVEKLRELKDKQQTLHIMGLLSDAGIHSHMDHLKAYIKTAVQEGITNIVVHAFLDGRDTPPRTAEFYLEKLELILKTVGHGKIGSIQGRFYAMDRNHSWDRTESSYRSLTEQQTTQAADWRTVVKSNYAQNVTDEFIPPTQLDPSGYIKPGDGIIFINIRSDRARQLTTSFIQPDFKKFKIHKLDLTFFITPVSYSPLLHTTVLYPEAKVAHCLKDVLAAHEKSQLSIAETEKYAHVTYFFSGGNEKIVNQEVRILVPSIQTASYANYPAMSAPLITQAVIKSLKRFPRDFYLVNYANADMVGHSGNLGATIKAIEILDAELKKIYDIVVEQMGGTMYITADHGKAEQMIDSKTGQPRTAHTTNPVPFVMIRNNLENSGMKLDIKELANIAPLILKNMGLPVPDEMKK